MTAYRQSGNKEYWGILYVRYMPFVYGVALKYLKNGVDAQDVVMQLFEHLTEELREKPVRVFKSWLYVCVRNFCLQELRKRCKDLSVSLDEGCIEICDDVDPFVFREEGVKEKILRQCVEALPEKQRISIYRFYIEERSYREIEEATGFSFKSVKSLIQNGKRNLRLCLERKGIVGNERK